MKRSFRLFALASLTLVGLTAAAHEADPAISHPGFRPPSEHSDLFVESLETATVAVLPSIVRRTSRSAHSFESQSQIATFLNAEDIATASTKQRRIKMLPLQQVSQWDLFQYGLDTVGSVLEGYETGADYTLVMEFLLPVDNVVWGIEIYVLDSAGRNAFSFLLNEHHEIFASAKLEARNSSEQARMQMIADATKVGLLALQQQIAVARECTAIRVANTRQTSGGVIHDFEGELSEGTDHHGQPIGFVPFSGSASTVKVSTTRDHPPRAGERDGNHVMQLDLNVKDWAGVAKAFENETFDTWVSYDWRDFDALSFWIYGSNSGSKLYVHVLDNRNPCSIGDDAERYGFDFTDDFSGWKQINVAFADMFRAEIGNGAPNDGLGLANVHGWGIGATKTNDSITYYIDDFELQD